MKTQKLKAVLGIAGLIALVAVIGFGMIGCDNGSDPNDKDKDGDGPAVPTTDVFTGTWTGQNNDGEMILTASNGSFTVSGQGHEAYRGTYTVYGNEVTITFTEINEGFFLSGTDRWVSYDDVSPEVSAKPPAKTTTGTISGGQFILPEDMDNMTFTKQGGGSPSGPAGPGTPSGDPSKLTITGLGAYNGKYIAAGQESNPHLIAAESIDPSYVTNYTYTGAQITNGSVTLNVWTKDRNETMISYISTQSLTLNVTIYGSDQIKHESIPIARGTITVSFTKGGGSAQIGNITRPGQLTITGLGSYTNKYAIAFSENNAIIGAESLTSPQSGSGAKISNGSVTLNVWSYDDNKHRYDFYTGNGSKSFTVLILDSAEVPEGTDPTQSAIAMGTATVSFTNGNGSGTCTLTDNPGEGGKP